MSLALKRINLSNQIGKIETPLGFLFLALSLLGPLKLPTPLFSDIRQMIPLTILVFISLALLNPVLRRTILLFLDSLPGLLLSLFYLAIGFSFFLNPSSEPKTLLVFIFSPLGFLLGYLLTRITPPKNLLLLERLNKVIFFLGVLISFYSLLVFVLGTTFVESSSAFIIDKIGEYQLYDLARGRIYPLTPIEFFLAFISYRVLLKENRKRQLFYLPVLFLTLLALFVSNYRLKTLWGLFVVIAVWVKRKAPLKTLLIPVVISVVISLLFLPTNFLERISLIRSEDIKTITDRFHSLDKSLALIRENPLKGIGLGNYLYYADWKWTTSSSTEIVSYENPHNLYLLLAVEAGLPVSLFFILLIIYLIRNDLLAIRRLRFHPLLPFYLTSWVFIFNSAFDWYPANLMVYLFFLRGIIYGFTCRSGNRQNFNRPF